MVEHPTFVRCQSFVGRLSQPDVEDPRALLLDVDDVPRREIEQRRGDGVVGDAEAVGEEVRDGGGFGSQLERPRADRRLRGTA